MNALHSVWPSKQHLTDNPVLALICSLLSAWVLFPFAEDICSGLKGAFCNATMLQVDRGDLRSVHDTCTELQKHDMFNVL